MKELSPPVGVYNDPRCALELLKKTTGVKKSPFGITAVRFTRNHKKCSTPGQCVSVCVVSMCVVACAPIFAVFNLDAVQSGITF